MSGATMLPMEAAVAGAEPQMVPNMALDTTPVTARPPVRGPTRALAKRSIRLLMPPLPMISPASRKKGIASRVKESTPPMVF